MIGYLSDYLDFGIGLRGGKTLDNHIYIGGTFVYQFGESGGGTVATGLGTTANYSWSSAGFYVGPEGGYDFDLRYVVLRPYLGLGIFSWGSSASGPGGGGSGSSTQFVVWPGCTVIWNVPNSNFFLGGDVRLVSVPNVAFGFVRDGRPPLRDLKPCTTHPLPPASFTPPPLPGPARPRPARVDHGGSGASRGDRPGLSRSSSRKRAGRTGRGPARSVVRIVLANESGTGFFVAGPDSQAYVVTAHHVVDSGERILVERTVDGPGGSHWTEAYPDAEVVAFDADADLAVIRLNGRERRPLHVAAARQASPPPTRPSSRTASRRAASRRGRAWCRSQARC